MKDFLEESRIHKFQQHEPIWGAPGVTAWQVLKFRFIRLFVIDILTPATPFAILTTTWLYHWLYSGHLENTIFSLAILFVYMISWLLLIRRQEAGMLLQALASLIKGISIKWGNESIPTTIMPAAQIVNTISTRPPNIHSLLEEANV